MCGEYIDALEIEDLLRKRRESDTRFGYIQTILERIFFSECERNRCSHSAH